MHMSPHPSPTAHSGLYLSLATLVGALLLQGHLCHSFLVPKMPLSSSLSSSYLDGVSSSSSQGHLEGSRASGLFADSELPSPLPGILHHLQTVPWSLIHPPCSGAKRHTRPCRSSPRVGGAGIG